MDLAADDRITAFGLFIEAFTAVHALIERELEAVSDLSAAEFGVLLRLARTPGGHLRMTDLAAGAGLTTSGMTRLVDRLETNGLVERAACPNDRRGLEAVLTPKGGDLVAEVLPAHLESLERHVSAPLGGDLARLEGPMRTLRDSARGRSRRHHRPVEPPFLAACNGRPASRTPVWFMRQAGRSLPEYRELRAKHPRFDDVIHLPELAAEVTLQPVRRLGVDAAILFSDLLTPVQAIVPGIEVTPGAGPVVSEPFRTRRDLDRLRPLEPDTDIPYVLEAARLACAELPPEVPLIGFAGAPFTIASYLVEGGKSRDYRRTKALMFGDTATWTELATRLADITIAALRAQVAAGAQAVQVFDSWVGSLSADDYRRYVLPATKRIFDGLADLGVPRIHFGVGTQHLVQLMHEAGADVVGLDWRTPLADARALLGENVPVQGNLDPVVLFAPPEVVDDRVRAILDANAGRPGHIFNLGWGVLPETDPDMLKRVVDLVHDA